MMKGIYFDGKKARFRDDIEKPVPTRTESLIRVTGAGICNTDREVLRGYRPDFRGIMGHEFTGVVEQSPDSRWIGKRVVGELNAGCGVCVYCQSGREKHCESRRVIGMEGKDGCFAEYMTLETHLLHQIPDQLPFATALLTEPLAAALEITKQIHFNPDVSVVIIGDGRLAYMIASVLHLQGVNLTILGKHQDKLVQFKPFGQTITATTKTFEVVIEATGSPSGLQAALDLVRKQGTIVLKSTYAGAISVDMSFFVVHEITLIGSRCGSFPPALRLLEKGLVHLPEVEFYRLDEMEQAFASGAFKAGFLISKE